MQRLTRFIIIALFLGSVFYFHWPIHSPYQVAIQDLPVQHEGRIKPFDTLARSTLLLFSNKQTLLLGKQKVSATEWLMDVAFNPQKADTYPVFRVDHPELLDLVGKNNMRYSYCSYQELTQYFGKLHQQQKLVPQEAALQSPYEQQLVRLCSNLTLYNRLVHSFHPLGLENTLDVEYWTWLYAIEPGVKAIQDRQKNQSYDHEALETFIAFSDRYLELSKKAIVGIIPQENTWSNSGQAWLDCIEASPHPALLSYVMLTVAYNQGNIKDFQKACNEIKTTANTYIDSYKISAELLMNRLQLFFTSIIFYICIFLLVLVSWLTQRFFFYQLSYDALWWVWWIHTIGLALRIYIQERPPVTNLYSSAIFIGWACVLAALFLERIYKNGLGTATACIGGATTLTIAHHLSLSGDTLEMMRAVLNSNFWLSTHVVTVTLGYSAMFLMGIIAMIFSIRSMFRSIDEAFAKHAYSMAYGTLLFAMLFSFIGTMLGGVWASVSWGRFWGWDPKENGALLIVLWCAIMLHARLAKWIHVRGFMALALGGNIVTAWSWFGTNMLGVGLHSYGFMDKAFMALAIFILSQCLLMIPLSRKDY